jgi:hypothetical protein
MPCLTELHSLFYPAGKKEISYNIYELLTPVAFTHLIMGDGSSSRSGLVLCTDSYKLIDVIRLMNVLIIRYRLECKLRYHTPTQPRIYIRECSIPLLRTILKPYMCSTMLYKLDKVVNTRRQYTTSSFSSSFCSSSAIEECFSISISKSFGNKLGFSVLLKFILTQHSTARNDLTSFIDFLGSFQVKINDSNTSSLVFSVHLKFQVTQATRDEELLKNLIHYLGCGRLEIPTNGVVVHYVVSKFKDIISRVT